jgi:hypothetical protein
VSITRCRRVIPGSRKLSRQVKHARTVRRSGDMGFTWQLLVAVAGAVQSPDPPAAVRLTYLANEGVMLSSARGRVLIDALFGDGLPDYAVVPHPLRDSLERAAGDYGGPALVLSTHAHRDHYDSAAVARYVANNPNAVVLEPPGLPPHDAIHPADLGWGQGSSHSGAARPDPEAGGAYLVSHRSRRHDRAPPGRQQR